MLCGWCMRTQEMKLVIRKPMGRNVNEKEKHAKWNWMSVWVCWKCFCLSLSRCSHSYIPPEHQHRNVCFDFASFRQCRETMFARIIYSHLSDFKKIISICMIRVVVVIVEVFTLFVTPCLYLHTLKIGKHKRCNYFWFDAADAAASLVHYGFLHSLFHTQHCNALWFCWLCAWNLNPMLLVRMIWWFYELLHLCIAILHSHTYSLVWRWIICAQTNTHTHTRTERDRVRDREKDESKKRKWKRNRQRKRDDETGVHIIL